jgi:hypothetical protein
MLLAALRTFAELPPPSGEYVATRTLSSSNATQAAAADEEFVYAISNARVVKFDRVSFKELSESTGHADHLNSGFLWRGKLYCAHSNYPRRPHTSDIRVLDPKTMELKIFHAFVDPPGSLTWAVVRDGQWWCHFAHYGKENAKSVLVRFADGWKETARWTFPAELVADWGSYSLSGGVWQGGFLLVTGHDKRLVYRLALPENGGVARVVGVLRSPFPGQGIAADPKTGGLVGIDRAKRMVVFAELNPR